MMTSFPLTGYEGEGLGHVEGSHIFWAEDSDNVYRYGDDCRRFDREDWGELLDIYVTDHWKRSSRQDLYSHRRYSHPYNYEDKEIRK